MASDKVAAIILGYKEPGWTDATMDCAKAAGVPYVVLYRKDGIGPMSSIFNQGMDLDGEIDLAVCQAEFVWHLTNVTFAPDMPAKLLAKFDDRTAAVHPAFVSDHPHMRKGWDKPTVPFVEWTAPMVRRAAWDKIGPLDERLPYWGMDISWSYRARQLGWRLKVATDAPLGHTYLRDVKADEHPVTTARRAERDKSNRATEQRLIELHGDDYLATIWPTHPYVAQGRKRLY